MLIVFCVERPGEEGTPFGWEWSFVAVLVVCEVWGVCRILKGF